MVRIDGFDVDELREGFADRTFELHRGRRRADGKAVLVRVPAPGAAPALARSWFATELAIAQSLDPRWAASPLGTATCEDGRPALIVEDAGGVPLAARERPLETADLLALAIALVDAVAAMHRAGLLHGSLTPLGVLQGAGAVHLTSFAVTTRIGAARAEDSLGEAVLGLEAALPYMAPELTAHVRAAPDERSDHYALGVLLYELATGALPFRGADALEWAHGHVAAIPRAPHALRPALPPAVGEVILKLLAKTPSDRYQSCAGLRADLERCLQTFLREGRVDPFPLGGADVAGNLRPPRRLYGRDAELAELSCAVARVARTGAMELALLSGGSGTGKTALARALREATAGSPVWFLSGKFNQIPVEVPYSPFVQAFTEAVGHLLAADSEELAFVGARIAAALGMNGRLVTDVIPHLELLVGPQPPVPELPPAETKHRFSMVLSALVGAIAHEERTLVLFLDDLQWADTASLELVRGLLTRREARHVLVLAACRDDALEPGCPLTTMLSALEDAGVPVRRLPLAPLSVEALGGLTSEALGCDAATGAALARLLAPKTGGNCFHFLQLLKALHRGRYVRFAWGEGGWLWDARAIRALPSTDDVVGLMIGRLRALPPSTRDALVRLACLGARVDANVLANVTGLGLDALARELGPAVDDELIVCEPPYYRFAHDRVQQAALELAPAGERASVHLAVARALDAGGTAELSGPSGRERLFAIVNQYRLGAPLVREPEEQRRVAALALEAGHAAKASAAYEAALSFLGEGLAILPAPDADADRALSFELRHEAAECAWLAGLPSLAKRRLEALLEDGALGGGARARALCRLIEVMTTLGEMDVALAHLQRCLALLGVALPSAPTAAEVEAAYAELWAALDGRPIPSLLDLPELDDPALRLAMDAMAAAIPAAVFSSERMPAVLLCRMATLSMRHGNSAPGASGYAYLAMLLAASDDRAREGYELGRLAVDLVERRGFIGNKPRIYVMFGNVVNLWSHPMATCIPYVREAFVAARALGDLTGACYCCNHLVASLLAMGRPLAEVDLACEEGLTFVRQANYADVADILVSHQRLVHAMQGRTRSVSSFDAEGFSAAAFDERVGRSQMTLLRFWHGTITLQARVLAGDFAEALEAGRRARELLWSSPSDVHVAEHQLYYGVALAADAPATPAERDARRAELARILARFTRWAERCPETFLHKRQLLSAELARLDGRRSEALASYAEAIQSASDAGFLPLAGLAAERTAALYRASGQPVVADAFVRQAAASYRAWGADGKVHALARAHPDLDLEPATAGARTAITRLDLLAAIKASQALSGEIELRKLLHRLLSIALESSGAQRCVLVLLDPGAPPRVSEAKVGGAGVELELACDPATLDALVPDAVVNYVKRTREALVVDDTSSPGPLFQALRARSEASVLCLPVLSQGRLLGLVYFAHGQLTALFTAERRAFLELLAAQFAISVENARLYASLVDENQKRTAAEERLALAASSARLGIWDWDVEADRMCWDDEMFRIYGATAEGRFGFAFWERCLHPEDREAAVAACRAALAGDGAFDSTFRIQRPDGAMRHVRAYGLVLRDAKGAARRMLGVHQDVTEQTLLEARLSQAEKLSSLGQLAGGIAHNFNNQLMGILGYADLLLRSDLDDEQREFASSIVASSRRAADLTAQLLAFARKAKVVSVPVDLHRLIDETAEMLRHGIGTGPKITISRALDAPEHVVLGDASQLQSMLLNLALNARDAMPEGGKLTFVTATEELSPAQGAALGVPEGRYVRVAVSDTGTGMTPEVRKHLFEPFFTTKPVGKGTGLGLASVHGTVAHHHGAIEVESELHVGTTFTLHFPLRGAEPPRSRGAPASAPGAGPVRRLRVLVVDDEAVVLRLCEELLRALGCDVIACRDGAEALARYREEWRDIDVVILDVRMPHMGGREVFAAMRAIHPDVRALVASGFSIDDEARRLLEAGAAGFIQKPFTLADLDVQIRRVMAAVASPQA